MENIYKKMNSDPINKRIDFSKYLDPEQFLAYYDYITDTYYQIDEIRTLDDGQVYRKKTEISENGVIIGESTIELLPLETLYDLDQILGGAFSMTLDKQGNLINSDHNIDISVDIMIAEDLKDKMIAHLVNKSAIKVGAGNINPMTSWKDNSELSTLTMSTRFGGVQMDAEHDLEFSEVTEMTQMMNSLVQNGFTHDLVTKIYYDVGAVIAKSMGRYVDTIESKDKGKLYEILAKSLIEAFETGDTETIGLAQSFVRLAERNLQKSNFEFTLPFSANTINGKFISVVTTNLVKSGIRRKYAGIGAVQNPANNVMQY